MIQTINKDNLAHEEFWKNNKIEDEYVEGESRPFAHPFGAYVKTTSFQRLQFRADGLVGKDPNYFCLGYNVSDIKRIDNHNKWRFIIEYVFKISKIQNDEFFEKYRKYRCVIIECQEYTKLLNQGKNNFYKVTGITMSLNLKKLYDKQLFYF